MSLDGIAAFIFDLGGTLYRPDSTLGHLARQNLIEAGIEQCESLTDEDIERALNEQRDNMLVNLMLERNVDPHWEPTRDDWIAYDRGMLEILCIDGDLETLAEKYQDKWDEYISSYKPNLIDGCKEALLTLKEMGYQLGIASNRFGNPTKYLKTDGILDLFEMVEYTAVPGYAKPSPYMLFRVSTAMGLNPKKCAYVGNIVEYDVIAAQNAGMTPILLTWCDSEQAELAPDGTISCEDIRELFSYL